MMTLLAETSSTAAQGIDPAMVGTIIGGVMVALVGGGVIGKKITDGTRIRIDPQPLEVALRKEYVTRAEFAEFKGELKTDVKEMRGLFDKAVNLIAERDERINNRITELDNAGDERRRKIYDRLENHDRLICAIDARTDVSKAIGKAAAAIMSLANNKST